MTTTFLTTEVPPIIKQMPIDSEEQEESDKTIAISSTSTGDCFD